MTDHDFEMVIGAPKVDRAERRSVKGGARRGVSYEIWWDRTDNKDASGTLKLMLGGRVLWGDEDEGIRCDLSGFLNFLSAKWNLLLLEQTYPGGVTPTRPSELEKALRAETDLRTGDIQLLVRKFRRDHDLSAWASTARMTPFWVLREGNYMFLEAGGEHIRWPCADTVRSLTSLGNAIYARLEDLDARADLRDRWEGREKISDEQAFAIAVGI